MPGWGMLYQSNQRIRDWAWALDKTGFKYLSMGFAIGITGWICDDRRAKELREAVSIYIYENTRGRTDGKCEEEYRKDVPDWRLMIVAVVFQTAAVF